MSLLDLLVRAHRDVDLVVGSPEYFEWVLERQLARAIAAILAGAYAGEA